MSRNIEHRSAFCLATVLACVMLSYGGGVKAEPASTKHAPQLSVSPSGPSGRYVFSVTLHTEQEIDGLLTRAEKLSNEVNVDDSHAGIALVLHGPEIELFAKQNYKKYQRLVDKAAKLDANQIIDIKICSTKMRELDLDEDDIPAFIEIVPYGPDEEQRLRREGYLDL